MFFNILVYMILSDKIKMCNGEKNSIKMIQDTFVNLKQGILFCQEIAESSTAYSDENLESLKSACSPWLEKLNEMELSFQKDYLA